MLRKPKREPQASQEDETKRAGEPVADSTPDNTKQERPRICLIDVDTELVDALESRGFNCYQGTLGPVVEIPNTSRGSFHQCLPNHDFPPNMHEYDIVVIDLQNPTTKAYDPEDHTHKKSKGQEQYYFVSSFPETLFDPRPLSASVLSSQLRPLKEKESILIVFTAPQEDVVYQPVSITVDGRHRHNLSRYSLYDFYSNLPRWENITGKDTTVVAPQDVSITALLTKHNADTTYTIAFNHPTDWENDERVKSKNFIPLMTAGPEQIVAFAHARDKNRAFFFPRFKDKQGFLCDLLERVLPGIAPPLFPYSTQFAWLDDPRYRLPNEAELFSQRERIEAEYRRKLDALDVQIDANREEYVFLHGLLTESGAPLVKTVERMFRWLDFEDVVNVDETDPDMKEEDLRVKSASGLLVIEVKGIGGTSTDAECSQISKVKYRRSKERNSFDVFGLYCVNHQRFLPPHNRQNPPFNSTQIQDAQNDDRGLLTTYELFKLYFNVSRGFVSRDDARQAMVRVGLVTFPPTHALEIPQAFEVHHNGFVVVFQADGIALRNGLEVILDDAGWYSSGFIEEIQVAGTTVETASASEVGIRLSVPLPKGGRLWIRETPQEEEHPTIESNATSG